MVKNFKSKNRPKSVEGYSIEGKNYGVDWCILQHATVDELKVFDNLPMNDISRTTLRERWRCRYFDSFSFDTLYYQAKLCYYFDLKNAKTNRGFRYTDRSPDKGDVYMLLERKSGGDLVFGVMKSGEGLTGIEVLFRYGESIISGVRELKTESD